MKVYKIDVRRYRDALRDAVELPITTRGVLYVLAQWMNVDGSNARPRLTRLAASCQLRQRAVAKHLSAAVTAGYLHRTSSGHKGRTAVYQATIPEYRWDPEACTLVQPLPVVEPGQSLHAGAGNGAKGCTLVPQRLHAETAKPAPACSPTSVETSLLLQRSRVRAAFGGGPTSRPDRAHEDQRFDPERDDPAEWLENNLGGLEIDEEGIVQGMLNADYHPHAIYNTIMKRRQDEL